MVIVIQYCIQEVIVKSKDHDHHDEEDLNVLQIAIAVAIIFNGIC